MATQADEAPSANRESRGDPPVPAAAAAETAGLAASPDVGRSARAVASDRAALWSRGRRRRGTSWGDQQASPEGRPLGSTTRTASGAVPAGDGGMEPC